VRGLPETEQMTSPADTRDLIFKQSTEASKESSTRLESSFVPCLAEIILPVLLLVAGDLPSTRKIAEPSLSARA